MPRNISPKLTAAVVAADVEPAEVGQARALRAGRDVEEELAIAGPGEHVVDAQLGEGARSSPRSAHRACARLVTVVGGDEAHLAAIGEPLAAWCGRAGASPRSAWRRKTSPSRRRGW